jgi:hypothetical protein
MYKIARDEKTTLVMVYARNKLVRGELVTKQDVRVNIWLRSQGVPNYIHLLRSQVWFFGGEPPRSLEYAEYFLPAGRIIGFHLAPPISSHTAVEQEFLDYDASVPNRSMLEVECILGAFIVKGKVRTSTQVDLPTNVEMMHMTWLSVYDADISSPFLNQMPVIHVPFALINPDQVSLGLR